jgi:hypothetical protein
MQTPEAHVASLVRKTSSVSAAGIISIERRMRIFLGTVFLSVGLALALPLLRAGTAGSFRGKVVESDATAVDPNWIYVEGRNHAIRRVEISHAHVEYDEAVPATSRKAKPERSLLAGTEVRVTAEQGKDGEWRASRIEILNIPETSGADRQKKS